MASRHDWHWTFGNRCYISFPNGGAPVDGGPGNANFASEEGCATIADVASGVMLCATDGTRLFNQANQPVGVTGSIGGTTESAHGAIVIPPAGGGARHHIFGVAGWIPGPSHKPVTYSAVTISGGLVTVVTQPMPLPIGPQAGPGKDGASERLAAISHVECDKFWVIAQSVQGGHGALHAMLVDSDAMPSVEVVTPYPAGPVTHQHCVKFSPDGTRFAVVNQSASGTSPQIAPRIDILRFSRATGVFTVDSSIIGFTLANQPYGVEFSPNSQYLYFTDRGTGEVRRHPVAGGTTNFSAAPVVSQWSPTQPSTRVGALQLGPNGKIYGVLAFTNGLFEIGAPDSGTATPGGVQFAWQAIAAGGLPLAISGQVNWGLPTLPRIADDCQTPGGNGDGDDRCARLAAEVDKQLAGVEKFNPLRPCDDSQPFEKPECHPLEIPPIAPWTSIRWGDSKCDCIEGDDTEVMHLTICNPYKNLTLSNLTVQQLIVVDANGNPVPLLPDGSPSIQLVPIGPYCFDDIAPCSCVTREFSVRLRGAPHGTYHIKLRGICFDACFHGDADACFQFNVCKD